MDLLLTLAFVAGVAAARADADRAAAPGGLVARGKEVIVVGAGDAGQLIVREMQRSRQLGYTPIGFVDDDPAKRHAAHPRRPRARHDRRPAAHRCASTSPTRC